jgi:hypothetical protein
MSYRTTKLLLLAATAVAVLALFGVQSALADGTIIADGTGEQTDNNSDGVCSLIEAMIAANTNSDYNECHLASGTYSDDTIQLQAGATYTLMSVYTSTDGATGLPDVTSVIIIAGQESTIIRDDNAPDFRIFHVSGSGYLVLDQVTVANGRAGTSGGWQDQVGGGIMLDSGGSNAYITNSTFESNVASSGGGIYNYVGTLVVSNTTFSDNHALSGSGGGGIFASGVTTVTNSVIVSNTASVQGGGIRAPGITLINSTILSNTAQDGGGVYVHRQGTFEDVTIRGNRAITGNGGGLYVNGYGETILNRVTIDHNQSNNNGGGIYHTNYDTHRTSLALTNVTVYNNTAQISGGGLYANYSSNTITETITYATFSGNLAVSGAGGNLYNNQAVFNLVNSIVADGVAGSGNANCDGNPTANVVSGGYNVETGTDCGLTATGDQQNTDPQLGPLQDNGGDTWTMALPSDSQAVNQIANGVNGCGTTVTQDQRGVTRPMDNACDVGAYEYEVLPQPPVADAGQDQIVVVNATVTLDGSGSYDPNGDNIIYGWTQTGGGPIVVLSSAVISRPIFMAPALPTVLTFTLVVTDTPGGLPSAPDTVAINVVENLYPVYLPLVLRSQ